MSPPASGRGAGRFRSAPLDGDAVCDRGNSMTHTSVMPASYAFGYDTGQTPR